MTGRDRWPELAVFARVRHDDDRGAGDVADGARLGLIRQCSSFPFNCIERERFWVLGRVTERMHRPSQREMATACTSRRSRRRRLARHRDQTEENMAEDEGGLKTLV